jgi:hypothetical protein
MVSFKTINGATPVLPPPHRPRSTSLAVKKLLNSYSTNQKDTLTAQAVDQSYRNNFSRCFD